MYPYAVINAVISFGLIYLAFHKVPMILQKVGTNQIMMVSDRSAPFLEIPPSCLLVFSSLIFGCACIFLLVAPLIKPPLNLEPYENLPYWAHVMGGWCIFFVGLLWWVWHYRLLPWFSPVIVRGV
jgi:hypothetical protein